MMKFFKAILFFTFMLASCGPQLIFTEPQPQGKKDRPEFKRKYLGSYVMERDSSLVLSVQPDLVFVTQQLNIAEPVSFFDSSEGWWLQDGKLIGALAGEDGIPVSIHNDSVFGRWTVRDTLFVPGDKQVLRHHKGRYFLNKSLAPGEWQVRSLWLEKDRLIMADINYAEDIERMKELSLLKEVQTDSGEVTGYKSSPSRKELSEYLNKGGFTHRDTFRRIK